MPKPRQHGGLPSGWSPTRRPGAIRAEGLLPIPGMPEGRPFFVPSASVPRAVADLLPLQQLAELERRANTGGTADAWILYGTALQRVGRPLSAAAAFDRAVEIHPDDVEAQTAAALVRFTKDDPSRAFSKLGPLSKEHPDAAVVRFISGSRCCGCATSRAPRNSSRKRQRTSRDRSTHGRLYSS